MKWLLVLTISFSALSVEAQQNTLPANGKVGIGTLAPLSPLSVSGQVVIGTPYQGDASLHINQTYGCCGRFTQLQPMFPSQNALNIAASTDASSNYQWFSWGVNAGTWTINPGTDFSSAAPFMITSSGTVLANGLVLNNRLPADNADSVPHNYKIATLPASSVGTADHLHLLVDVNYSWGASANQYIDATFANRNGFAYQYTLRGAQVSPNARLTAYRNSDGTVDIYIGFGANSFSLGTYTVVENLQETVYPAPVDVGVSPSGTLVFDSSSSDYPPATYTDNDGNLTVRGNIKLAGSGASIIFPNGSSQSMPWNGTLCGGDYAESVDVRGERAQYEPGDVLVVDPQDPGKFLKSSQPYSMAVSGVYSTKPGLVGRRQTTDPKTGTSEIPMAMVGIVPTKVTAENGAIHPGDVLVTSSTMGHAMKGTDRSQFAGAIVGKALGTLESGTGVIEVLISLQ